MNFRIGSECGTGLLAMYPHLHLAAVPSEVARVVWIDPPVEVDP